MVREWCQGVWGVRVGGMVLNNCGGGGGGGGDGCSSSSSEEDCEGGGREERSRCLVGDVISCYTWAHE